MSATPIDSMMDRIDWRCTHCGAKAGTCDCTHKCKCGWFVPKDGQCRNEVHRCPTIVVGKRCVWEVGHRGACEVL